MTALNPVKTIGDQVSESVCLHQQLSRDEAAAITRETLDRVGLPNSEFPLSRYPHELSGGQRQRVVIAIAVACKPRLLIADEPTTALDVTTQAGILELLKELQQEQGLALMLITHDLAVVSNMADNIVVMNRGQVMEQGKPHKVFAAPKNEYTRQLFSASSLARRPPGTSLPGADSNRQPLLAVSNLVCEYPLPRKHLFSAPGRFRAVDTISFDVHSGESIGLVGESGCGKSTLALALLGLMPMHSGSIHLGGESVSSARQVSHALRQLMQVVFQDPYGSFNPRHKVARLVSEPLHVMPESLSRAEKLRRIDEVLHSVGMQSEDKDKYIHEFSGGQRQRIAIARALIIRPRIIILDEAVSALDVSVRAQVLELLDTLAAQQGLAYLFISHDLSVVQRVTDRVMVMRRGQIVERGNTYDVFNAPKHEYTRALLAAAPVLRF
jgi:peptide/nickel transport system ATP-binding protein